ncbi:SNF related kinase b [Anguilla anguilla]|uniref:SNF related kinase b n=1 Tax=Anguilla anguilla TaxID=7936 RepID=UPI0015A7A3D5|nr:SNF related kinase b [Anguilla anguilla]
MAASKSGYEGKMAGLYDLDRTLGKGHFAVVKLARHVFTGQLVAVKVIDKTKLDAVATGHLLQEVRCMKLVQHPNVVRLYEVIDTQTRLYLILELADGGDLYDLILRHEGGVGEARAKVHFAQIVRAISYCHRLHVVHRDLKPENVVFFRQQGTVKLTDFGFSNHFQPGTMLMTSCGSLAYSAPEILLGEEYDAPAVDIWSLGVILYMLVCGKPPFQETNDSETLTMIMDCRYTVPPHVSADCKDLIARMLQRDPSRRASLADIEEHPWLQGVDPSPSPAGRASAPLTSHHSLTPEEHQAILQAMSSGNIADRDTIQEALEANQYNHITATYYLLGERLLREKQEQQGQTETDHAPVPNLLQRPVSAPLDLEEGGRRDPLSGAPCRSREEERTFLFERPSSALTLHPAPPSELTPMKTVCALQQIFEEEEEEEEEEENTQVDLHQQERRQEDPYQGGGGPTVKVGGPIVAEGQVRGEGPEQDVREEEEETPVQVRNLAVDKAETEESGDVERAGLDHQVTEAGGGEGGDLPQTEGAESLNPAEAVEPMPSAESPQAPPSPGGSPGGHPEGAEPQAVDGDPKSVQEHNNNTLPNPLERSQPPPPASSPRGLPRNHCVDLGPDGVEARPGAPAPGPQGPQGPGRCGGKEAGPAGGEAGPEPAARAERGGGPKNRNVNLRDRLLQFPLCEKALSFNIQPTSKEKLLPFAQYNCCHVL